MSVEIGGRTVRLRPYLRHYEAPGAGIFLVSEHQSCLLRDPVFRSIVPVLDARTAVCGIDELLETGLDPVEVFRAIDSLRRNDYIEEQKDELPLQQASFWQTAGACSGAAADRLLDNPVRVIAIGDLDPGPLTALLSDSGARLAGDARRWVVATSDYLHSDVGRVAEEARAAGSEWLLCRPVGTEIWIGPVFGPKCCWHCLAHRLKGHGKAMAYLSARLGSFEAGAPDVPQLAATLHLGYAVAATQTVRWIVQGSNHLEDSILTLDVLTLQQSRHGVTRRPQCPACGSPGLIAAQQRRPVTLRERLKPVEFDNGHRICRLEETERKLAAQISSITGVVGAIRTNTLPANSPEWAQSYRVDDLCGRRDFTDGRMSRERTAGGKGVSAGQARVSALSEAIERYSGEFQGDEACIVASLRALGEQAIHPNACMLFSDRQYAEREERNARDTARETIPEPLPEAAEIEWSPVWPLDGGDVKYLPTAYCFYDAGGEGARFAAADSNGCAAGNCREEAILQGFLEIVERDAVAIWWYNRASRPAVDLHSFNEPFFDRMSEYHTSLHRELWALDLTTDLAIPAFAALSRRTDKEAEDIVLGFGAHPNARIAIQRALSEINQSLPGVIFAASSGADGYVGGNREAFAWWQTATLRSEPYLAAAPDSAPRTRSAYLDPEANDLRREVMECVGRAAARGLRTFVLDQTRPDTGLDVVRVIVPGMRHFRARFAPGRLYDVPVGRGWLSRATDESDLNRLCIYF